MLECVLIMMVPAPLHCYSINAVLSCTPSSCRQMQVTSLMLVWEGFFFGLSLKYADQWRPCNHLNSSNNPNRNNYTSFIPASVSFSLPQYLRTLFSFYLIKYVSVYLSFTSLSYLSSSTSPSRCLFSPLPLRVAVTGINKVVWMVTVMDYLSAEMLTFLIEIKWNQCLEGRNSA